MTGQTAGLLPGLVMALAGLGLGRFVPSLIGRLPEPAEPEADKEPYAVMAALPGLRVRACLAAAVVAGSIGLVLRP